MKYCILAALLFCGSAFSQSGGPLAPGLPHQGVINQAGVLKSGPFKDLNVKEIPFSAAQVIFAANYDFQRLIQNQEPVFAVQKGSALTDGGTRVFIGSGYRIVRYSSLTNVAGIKGLKVGVKVIFDEAFAPESTNEYAETRFILRRP